MTTEPTQPTGPNETVSPRRALTESWSIALPSFVFLSLIFFIRTAGIHFDENNYFSQAYRDPRGEAYLGKPPLFYALNFIFNHTVGFLLGPWRYLTPFFVYALFNAFALAWLSGRFGMPRRRRYLFVLWISLSPFYLFNGTQMMMELPILGLLCLLLGCYLPAEGKEPPPKKLLPTVVVLLLLMKHSTVPAMVALILGFWFWRPREARTSLKWLVLAFPMHWLIQLAIGARAQQYGGFSFLLDPRRWPSRLAMSGDYLGTWLFYLGPVLVLAVGWQLVSARREGFRRWFTQSEAGSLFLVGLLSLFGTFSVQMGSAIDFARYAYPVIWVGLLCWGALGASRVRALGIVLIAIGFLAPSLNMWVTPEKRFALWPRFIASEGPLSDGELFSGEPIFGWTFLSEPRFGSVCVWVSSKDHGRADRIQQYFRGAFPQVGFFDDAHAADFASCDGAKVVARQVYGDSPRECHCPGSEKYLIADCRQHPGTPEQSRGVWDLTCLP